MSLKPSRDCNLSAFYTSFVRHWPSFSQAKKAGAAFCSSWRRAGRILSAALSWRAACNPVTVPSAPFVLLALCAPRNTWPSDPAKIDILHLTWCKALVSLRKKTHCVMLCWTHWLIPPSLSVKFTHQVSVVWVFFDPCACHAIDVFVRNNF